MGKKKEKKKVNNLKPGDIVRQPSGRRYQVQNNGSWKRLQEVESHGDNN